jgi:hypothetical protein
LAAALVAITQFIVLLAGGIYIVTVYVVELIGTVLVFIWDFFISIVLGMIDFYIRVKNNPAVKFVVQMLIIEPIY